MRILKMVFGALAVLIGIALITALFVKKDYTVEREITINQPKQEVFTYIKYLKNQDNFSKWAKMDPAMKKSYRGTDGTVGFVSAWESTNEEVGTGEQEIKKVSEGERIDMELHFMEPFEDTVPAYMITEEAGENATKVRWGFSGHIPYPMNLSFLCMDFEKMVGDDFSTGLTNLKGILEN